MTQKTEDLDAVYGATSPEAARKLYDDWSGSYDAENLAKGFWLPIVAAGFFARHMGRTEGPLLDAGCGTGLVGQSLALMGYGPITGSDLSDDMMEIAARTGAYAGFQRADMGAGLPFDDAAFAGFTCIGAFGPGHAPPQSLEHLARALRPGGIGVFNVVEATHEEQGFPAVIAALEEADVWRVAERSRAFRAYLLKEPELLVRMFAVERL
ncbi:class I SAM-dependent methyltransferase [Roseovarius spongiae]|uniref:Class I SAM-dependent methyltransferase n=1 Tax=Roseovarius spongiae TaxID=2320272 RepID=A0A3A8BCB5_9RHOB|nr:class I SAM-dependent methyltransferase [Roseovarius spongiae]RKF17242.1 class I SAM-dependent methyltransferase [Roseovarius spongiae]